MLLSWRTQCTVDTHKPWTEIRKILCTKINNTLQQSKREKKEENPLAHLSLYYLLSLPPPTYPISPHFLCMCHVHQSHHIKNHFTRSQANKYKTKIKNTTPDQLAPFQSHASSKTDITHSVTFVGPQAETHHLSCHWLNKPLYIQKISCTLSTNLLSNAFLLLFPFPIAKYSLNQLVLL